MKLILQLCYTLIILMLVVPAFAQKYRTPSDTGRLNIEYVKVQNKIADLTAKLSTLKGGLPEYQTKAVNADNTAQTAVTTSDASSTKAISGNIQDVRDAKNSADNAYDKAKDARSANKDVGKQDEKIRKITNDLSKQQQRLKDLDRMRAAIYAQLPTNLNH